MAPLLRPRRIGWAIYLVSVILVPPLIGQELPTSKPEDVGVSARNRRATKFMQSLVDDCG